MFSKDSPEFLVLFDFQHAWLKGVHFERAVSKVTLWTVPIVVWCTRKIKQNAAGGCCPVFALCPTIFPCLCAMYNMSINMVRWVFTSGRYTCPPS